MRWLAWVGCIGAMATASPALAQDPGEAGAGQRGVGVQPGAGQRGVGVDPGLGQRGVGIEPGMGQRGVGQTPGAGGGF